MGDKIKQELKAMLQPENVIFTVLLTANIIFSISIILIILTSK